MKGIRSGIIIALFALMAVIPTGERAHAATTEEMMATIKTLMAQIESLKKQLTAVQSEVKAVTKSLREGMTSEEIGKIQELLATDKAIYPEGMVTKFYGPLTKEAVKRFQARHDLEVTGIIEGETYDFIQEYIQDGGKFPYGLLRSTEVLKRIGERFELKCDNSGPGSDIVCKKLKKELKDRDDNYEIEVEIEDGETTISFEIDGVEYEVTSSSTDMNTLLEAMADKLDVEVEDLNAYLVAGVKKLLSKELAEDSIGEDVAEDAIEAAEDAIEEAEEEIEEADGDTADAEELLEDAEDLLEEAEAALDAEDYSEAKSLAREAKDAALAAVDAL